MRKFLLTSLIVLFSFTAGAQSLEGINPATMYKDLIHLYNSNTGVSGVLTTVYDGAGNALPWQLSLTELNTPGNLSVGWIGGPYTGNRAMFVASPNQTNPELQLSTSIATDIIFRITGSVRASSFGDEDGTATTISWGYGTPEGTKIANRGSVYGDATNGEMYIKNIGSTSTGWERVARESELLSGSGANNLLRLDTSISAVLQTVKDGTGTSSRLQLSEDEISILAPLGLKPDTLVSSSENETIFYSAPIVNQTGSASYTGFSFNALETTTGTGGGKLIDLQVDSSSIFNVQRDGQMYLDGINSQFYINGTNAALHVDGPADFSNLVEAQNGLTVTENFIVNNTNDNSTGVQNAGSIGTVYDQASTAGSTDLRLWRTENTLGSGEHNFINMLIGVVSQASISNTGNIITKGTIKTTGALNLPNDGDSFIKLEALGYLTASSGSQSLVSFEGTVEQSGTAGYEGLVVDVTESTIGSGKGRIFNLKKDGVSMFAISSSGGIAATTTPAASTVTGNQFKINPSGNLTASTGEQNILLIEADLAQTGTAIFNGVKVDVSENGSTTTGDQKLIQLSTDGAEQFSIGVNGDAHLAGDVTVDGNINVTGGIFGDRACRTYGFTSQGIGAGTYYIGSWYNAPVAHAALTQASTTQTHGEANKGYGAHAFIVASGPGSVDAGGATITVSGTSVTDAGVRATGDSETLGPNPGIDVTALATNDYYETAKKWIGQVTFTIVPEGATTYSATFNYGFAKYEDCGNTDFVLEEIQVTGLGGAADNSFNFELLHHTDVHGAGNWVYSAAAFEPGLDETIADWVTDYGTESELGLGEYFAWKRSTLAHSIAGSGSEGTILRVTTGASNSVQSLDVTLCVIKE